MNVYSLGNRACLASQDVEDFPTELRNWVHKHCEPKDDVWLLPIGEPDGTSNSEGRPVRSIRSDA